ncbi:MAG TPA: ABC-type transport auxiliary lipoprotein family protein [Steroidobacteraceae bacterium]|nr:ABC-type transport auxiliary lipoprotein family protein [Steroidobacteraceae bacterium]
MSRQRCLLIPVMLALGGCSGLLRSTAPALQLYVLEQPVAVTVTADAGSKSSAVSAPKPALPTLRIDRPQAAPGLDTDRIALLRPGNRLDYYAGSRWSAPLPELVSDMQRMVFRDDGYWSAVADDRSGFNTNYLLQTSIDRFTAEYAGESAPPLIRVDLHGVLIRRADGSLVGSFAVSASWMAKENRMASVVEAFSQATQRAVLDEQKKVDQLLTFAKPPAVP